MRQEGNESWSEIRDEMRLPMEAGCTEHGDLNFLKHRLAFHNPNDAPRLEYSDVKITKLPPAKWVYGTEADTQEKKDMEQANG